MESYRRPNMQSLDQQAFEQMLQERLRDPTPEVIRRQNISDGCYGAPISCQLHPYSVGSCVTYHTPKMLTLPFPDAYSDSNGATTSFKATIIPSSEKQHPLKQQQQTLVAVESKRGYVLQELIDTECVYIKDLEILVTALAIPLCKYAGTWATQAEQVLQPLQSLFAFQYQFLKSLHECCSVSATAQLFSANANQFETYIDYCGAYHCLNDLLDRLRSDSKWLGFINEFHEKVALYSDKRRLSIGDFLIKPVQRICKYPLFLRDLLKHTNVTEEPDTSKMLEHAITLLRGICEGVDQVQQQIDSLKLRHRLISNYFDNPELPLSVVRKLGEVLLSGPLYIADCGKKGPESPRLLGCVLFKRFFLILKCKRARTLVPQFWFPLHTMRVVDDGLVHSWRLEHNKSAQFMVFQAKSSQEKHMWIDALTKAVAVSAFRIRSRRTKYFESPDMSLHRPQYQQQQKQQTPGKLYSSIEHESNIDTLSVSPEQENAQTTPTQKSAAIAAAAVAASPPPRATGAWRFWQGNPLALTRADSAEQQFKDFSSTEILRLRTAEALRQEQSPKSFPLPSSRIPSPPRFPFLTASLPSSHPPDKMSEDGNYISSRPSDSSYPSHATAVENEQPPDDKNYSEEYGGFSAGSTCHEAKLPQDSQPRNKDEQMQSKKQHCTYTSCSTQRRSLNDAKCSAAVVDDCLLDYAKNTLSDRLFGALGHLTHIRRKSTSTQEWICASGHANSVLSYHGRSFSTGCGAGY
ncbi:Dbl homology domain-containing protein [Coemansia reversa NRRL 1564]|uniref:Dbl homology domain-containing protein n=1 Tax=Coemansia reversa (strain ATCC 12441 / NRRL 1564) TaxID=763665 RepID=A0A2G5BF49_COERN|nr:Dbl homology domain-containing protein [Coemansia reversa NRRL 1564]|eukprot:PIA17612.1 Dbl homology domain-containing protein [Coemansia reversa NRRL 1564]